VYGVSGNKRSWYDNSNAQRLGYRPQDDAEQFADAVLAREKPGDPRAEMYQGGNFVFAEIGGDPNRAAPDLKKSGKRRSATKSSRPERTGKTVKTKIAPETKRKK
jgi:hypothetical protein